MLGWITNDEVDNSGNGAEAVAFVNCHTISNIIIAYRRLCGINGRR